MRGRGGFLHCVDVPPERLPVCAGTAGTMEHQAAHLPDRLRRVGLLATCLFLAPRSGQDSCVIRVKCAQPRCRQASVQGRPPARSASPDRRDHGARERRPATSFAPVKPRRPTHSRPCDCAHADPDAIGIRRCDTENDAARRGTMRLDESAARGLIAPRLFIRAAGLNIFSINISIRAAAGRIGFTSARQLSVPSQRTKPARQACATAAASPAVSLSAEFVVGGSPCARTHLP
jgi:hypothetical protein